MVDWLILSQQYFVEIMECRMLNVIHTQVSNKTPVKDTTIYYCLLRFWSMQLTTKLDIWKKLYFRVQSTTKLQRRKWNEMGMFSSNRWSELRRKQYLVVAVLYLGWCQMCFKISRYTVNPFQNNRYCNTNGQLMFIKILVLNNINVWQMPVFLTHELHVSMLVNSKGCNWVVTEKSLLITMK